MVKTCLIFVNDKALLGKAGVCSEVFSIVLKGTLSSFCLCVYIHTKYVLHYICYKYIHKYWTTLGC